MFVHIFYMNMKKYYNVIFSHILVQHFFSHPITHISVHCYLRVFFWNPNWSNIIVCMAYLTSPPSSYNNLLSHHNKTKQSVVSPEKGVKDSFSTLCIHISDLYVIMAFIATNPFVTSESLKPIQKSATVTVQSTFCKVENSIKSSSWVSFPWNIIIQISGLHAGGSQRQCYK